MTKAMGKLKVRFGPMGSGKTTWLIKQFKPGVTKIFVPDIDHRSGEALRSHDGMEFREAVVVVNHNHPEEILNWLDESTRRILIDEVNFWDKGILEVVGQIREKGIEVDAVGLLLDSDKRDFGATRALAKLSRDAKALAARCDYDLCREPAEFNYFKGQKPGQVVVGAFDLYGCACPKHYIELKQRYKEM